MKKIALFLLMISFFMSGCAVRWGALSVEMAPPVMITSPPPPVYYYEHYVIPVHPFRHYRHHHRHHH